MSKRWNRYAGTLDWTGIFRDGRVRLRAIAECHAAKMRDLAEGGYVERAEPVLFIGECGTGKELFDWLVPSMARWSRYDLIAIDEVGYLPLAEMGVEVLFQVVAKRARKLL